MPDRANRHGLRALLVFFVLIASVSAAGPAFAGFTSAPSSPAMTISSASLAAPTGLSASSTGCVLNVSTKVKLTWTATSSSWADGYQIFRSTTNGGPYSSVGTVSGQSTTTFTDSSVAFLTTYYYVVQATKLNWRSANSSQASITTLSGLCL
jgi:hypothetical protein